MCYVETALRLLSCCNIDECLHHTKLKPQLAYTFVQVHTLKQRTTIARGKTVEHVSLFQDMKCFPTLTSSDRGRLPLENATRDVKFICFQGQLSMLMMMY